MHKLNNLWSLLEHRVDLTPDATFLIEATTKKQLTFKSFLEESLQLAAHLKKLGVSQGDVVSWQLPTVNEAALLLFALSRLGAVQAPIIHLYRERETQEILTQSKPQFFIVKDDEGKTTRLEQAVAVINNLEEKPMLINFDELQQGDCFDQNLSPY